MTVTRLIALAAFGVVGPLTQQGVFPWKAGDPPPPVGGVPLAASRARIDSLLGAPDDSERLGADGWGFEFRARGLSIVYTPLDGAAVIYLLRRDAGDIGGVRLGDTPSSVLARWGKPTTTGGPNSLYIAGKWVVVVTADSAGTRVVQLGLGRVGDQD